MNERRNSKTYEVALSGRIVNENFNPNGAHHFIDWALQWISALCTGAFWLSLSFADFMKLSVPIIFIISHLPKAQSLPSLPRSCSEEQIQREFCQKILRKCKKVTPQKRMSIAWIVSTFLSAANARGSTQAAFYLNMYPNLTEITLVKYYLWNLTQDAKRWENCKSHNVDHSVSFNLIFCASCRFATRAHWPTIQEVNFSCSWLFRTCTVPSGNCAWKLCSSLLSGRSCLLPFGSWS